MYNNVSSSTAPTVTTFNTPVILSSSMPFNLNPPSPEVDSRISSISDNLTPTGFTTQTSSPSKPTTPTNFTTLKGVQETLATLRQFQVLMKGCMTQEREKSAALKLPENNEYLADIDRKDVSVVDSKRERVKMLAMKHMEALLNYSVYLRGILERVAKNNIETDLQTIENLLATREKKLAPSPSSLSHQNSPTSVGSIPNSSPLRDGPSSSGEKSEETKIAWGMLNTLAQLRTQLESLKAGFSFVEDEPLNLFAKQCRQNSYVPFLTQFRSLDTENASKWKSNSELIAISKEITACQKKIQEDLDSTPFVSTLPNTLVERVVLIAREFNAHFASASEKLELFQKIQEAAAVLKQMVKTEKEYEFHCDLSARRELYDLHVKQLKKLQQDTDECNIPNLIIEINTAMSYAAVLSEEIATKYEETQKIMQQFDSFKIRMGYK